MRAVGRLVAVRHDAPAGAVQQLPHHVLAGRRERRRRGLGAGVAARGGRGGVTAVERRAPRRACVVDRRARREVGFKGVELRLECLVRRERLEPVREELEVVVPARGRAHARVDRGGDGRSIRRRSHRLSVPPARDFDRDVGGGL